MFSITMQDNAKPAGRMGESPKTRIKTLALAIFTMHFSCLSPTVVGVGASVRWYEKKNGKLAVSETLFGELPNTKLVIS